MDAYAFPDLATLLRTIIILAGLIFAPGYIILRKKMTDWIELVGSSVLVSIILLAVVSGVLSLLVGLNLFTLTAAYAAVFVIAWKLSN